MEERIAVIAIIIEDTGAAKEVNRILHDYRNYIIGRMGIPYHKKEISLISVAMDAPVQVINALTGKLGNLENVEAKAAYSKEKKEKEIQ